MKNVCTCIENHILKLIVTLSEAWPHQFKCIDKMKDKIALAKSKKLTSFRRIKDFF